MKRIILCLSFFAFFGSQAQQINPVPDYVFSNKMSVGRNAVTDTAAYFSIGPRYGAIRGFMPPMVVDTASVTGTKRNGLLIFSIQKNKFLYWDSVRVQWSDMAGSSGSYITGTLTNQYVPKATGSTTIGNSILYDNGSTIGINSTSLNSYQSLDVNGRIRARTRNGGIVVGNPLDTGRTFAAAGNAFESAVWLEQYATTDAADIFLVRGRGTVSSRANAQINDVIGTIDYSAYVDTTILNSSNISAKINKIDTVNNVAESDVIISQITNNTYYENAKFKSYNGGLYIRGNTSIGDTSATERLDIHGKLKIRSIDSVATPINILATNSDGVIVKSAPILSGSGTTNYIPKYTSSNTFAVSQIFDNGTNVGINDASPSDKLVVNGRMRVNGTNRITFGNNSGGYASIGVSAATTGNLTFNTFDGTSDGERMRINASGELLISTTTDAGAYALQVAGAIYNTTTITTGAPTGGSIKPWRLGEAATVSPTSPNRTIRVEIDGTVYYIHAKTTND